MPATTLDQLAGLGLDTLIRLRAETTGAAALMTVLSCLLVQTASVVQENAAAPPAYRLEVIDRIYCMARALAEQMMCEEAGA